MARFLRFFLPGSPPEKGGRVHEMNIAQARRRIPRERGGEGMEEWPALNRGSAPGEIGVG